MNASCYMSSYTVTCNNGHVIIAVYYHTKFKLNLKAKSVCKIYWKLLDFGPNFHSPVFSVFLYFPGHLLYGERRHSHLGD